MSYIEFSGACQGKPHIRPEGNIECQDAAKSVKFEDGIIVAALSDGHGDPLCFRSSLGSLFAVDIAVEKAHEFSLANRDVPSLSAIQGLCAQIVDAWLVAVDNDGRNNPVRNEELSRMTAEERTSYDMIEAYGATLQVSLLSPSYLLLLEIGDGRTAVLHEDGHIDQPIPWDESCENDVTTSLCNRGAADLFRHRLIPSSNEKVVGVIQTSDGLEKLFWNMEALNAFLVGIALDAASAVEDAIMVGGRSEEVVNAASAQFNSTYIPYLLQNNNEKDDVSITGIIDTDEAIRNRKWYEKIRSLDLTDYDVVLESIDKDIASKEYGISAAQRKIRTLEESIAERESNLPKHSQETTSFATLIASPIARLKAKLRGLQDEETDGLLGELDDVLGTVIVKDEALDKDREELDGLKSRLAARQAGLIELQARRAAVLKAKEAQVDAFGIFNQARDSGEEECLWD